MSRSLGLAETFRSLFDQNASKICTSGDECTPRIHPAGQTIFHCCIEAFRVNRMGWKRPMAVMLLPIPQVLDGFLNLPAQG